jgi:hypothetical protein
MQLDQLKTLETARRVQAFLDRHAALLGNAITRALRAWLDSAVDQLAAFQLEQELAQALSRYETARQKALRRGIRDRFTRPIGTIANRALRSIKAFGKLTKRSSTSGRSSDFARAATLMADAAEQKARVFVGHGMPTDFVDEFRAALAELAKSVENRARYRDRHAWATAGVRETTKSLRGALAVVDSVLKPALRGDRALLAEWRRDRRVDLVGTRVNV